MMFKVMPKRSPGYAYKMGRDCKLNGPTEKNCDFTLFATPALTAEWERGQREATAKNKGKP